MDWQNNFVFFGSSKISALLLDGLIKLNYTPKAIISIKSKPAGRGLKVHDSLMVEKARQYQIPLIEIDSFKKDENLEKLKAYPAQYAILLAFGKIIPQAVLNFYPQGILNIHPSLLPKYRGPSPLQTALLNGDKITGVSLIKLDAELDHGDILGQAEINIDPIDTYTELELKVVDSALHLIQSKVELYLSGGLMPTRQDHSQASFTKKITKEGGQINWQSQARQILNQFNAFTPWPGIWTTFNGKRLKLLSIALFDQPTLGAGQVRLLDNKLIIGAGDYNIEVRALILEGKKQATALDFVKGHKEFIGAELK